MSRFVRTHRSFSALVQRAHDAIVVRTVPVLVAAAGVAGAPAIAHAASAPPAGCGSYLCLTVLTGPLSAAPATGSGALGAALGAGWVGVFASTQATTPLPALEALGATSYEWHVSVVGHYVAYCAAGVVCDRDTFNDYLSGGMGIPARSVAVFGAAPDMPRDWDVRIDSPVRFAAYDAAGRVVATDSFSANVRSANVVLTPEPTSVALAATGLVGLGLMMRRRTNG